MRDGIDAIVASTSDHPAQTGLMVGVLKGGHGAVHRYGAVSGAPPAGNTLFEIGSVTQVFTTTLLSILVAEGTVALDDSVADLAAKLSAFPPQITLQHLATHAAGLPKMPSNMLGSMLRDRGNPYAAYAMHEMRSQNEILPMEAPSPRAAAGALRLFMSCSTEHVIFRVSAYNQRDRGRFSGR